MIVCYSIAIVINVHFCYRSFCIAALISQLIDSLMDQYYCYSLISLLVILHHRQLIICTMVRNCSVALM